MGSLPGLVLAGLTLGAVRRLFTGIGQAIAGAGAGVQSAAGVAAGWMQFCRIALWLGVVLGLLNGLLSLPNLLGGSGPGDGETVQVVLGGLALVPLGWLYSVLLRLAGHSRLFALEAASVLDHPDWGPPQMCTQAQIGQGTKDP